jgi:hypothetical protein
VCNINPLFCNPIFLAQQMYFFPPSDSGSVFLFPSSFVSVFCKSCLLIFADFCCRDVIPELPYRAIPPKKTCTLNSNKLQRPPTPRHYSFPSWSIQVPS